MNFSGKQLNMREIDALTHPTLERAERVLLHCCCAPCATSVVERILPHATPTLYWFNPNIQPLDEQDKRLGELKKLARIHSLELIAEESADECFTDAVRGFEDQPEGGARCPLCFALRLRKTAQRAKELGFDAFATTLTVSPHKNAELINTIGFKLEEETGVKWIPADFKKRNGYLRSTQISRELGLYRQDYCGCNYAREAVEK